MTIEEAVTQICEAYGHAPSGGTPELFDILKDLVTHQQRKVNKMQTNTEKKILSVLDFPNSARWMNAKPVWTQGSADSLELVYESSGEFLAYSALGGYVGPFASVADAQAHLRSGLLDRVVARLDEAEAKNRGYEKMQRDYVVRIGKYYQRQLQRCDEMLTKAGVPEWVMNSDSNDVPGNAVAERLKWYLARRKDVKPEEAEPQLQAEMAANISAASAYRSV